MNTNINPIIVEEVKSSTLGIFSAVLVISLLLLLLNGMFIRELVRPQAQRFAKVEDAGKVMRLFPSRALRYLLIIQLALIMLSLLANIAGSSFLIDLVRKL